MGEQNGVCSYSVQRKGIYAAACDACLSSLGPCLLPSASVSEARLKTDGSDKLGKHRKHERSLAFPVGHNQLGFGTKEAFGSLCHAR